jgi:hypothetical protein
MLVNGQDDYLSVIKTVYIFKKGREGNLIYLRFQMPATVSGWTLYEASVALQIICGVNKDNIRTCDLGLFMYHVNHIT